MYSTVKGVIVENIARHQAYKLHIQLRGGNVHPKIRKFDEMRSVGGWGEKKKK